MTMNGGVRTFNYVTYGCCFALQPYVGRLSSYFAKLLVAFYDFRTRVVGSAREVYVTFFMRLRFQVCG